MLTTFFIASFRKSDLFEPGRVRLSRTGVCTLETALQGMFKGLEVSILEEEEYRTVILDRTVKTKPLAKLVQDKKQISYLPFAKGAQRILDALKPDDWQIWKTKSLKVSLDASLKPNSTIRDEATEPSVSKSPENNFDLSDYTQRFNMVDVPINISGLEYAEIPTSISNWKHTISQLEFWVIKGLDVISTAQSINIPEVAIIKELFYLLVSYLQTLMFFVVKPVLESPDLVKHVYLAQRYHKAFQVLEKTSESPIQMSMIRELKIVIRTDWIEVLKILEEPNREIISRHFEASKKRQADEDQFKALVRYPYIEEDHVLIEYQNLSTIKCTLTIQCQQNELPTSAPNECHDSRLKTHKFDIYCYKTKLIILYHSQATHRESQLPISLIVNFDYLEQRTDRGNWSSNENFIVKYKKSEVWFTTTEEVLKLMEVASKTETLSLEVKCSSVFQVYKIDVPIKVAADHEYDYLYWRLLQQGCMQVYLPSHGWNMWGWDSFDSYHKNDSHCEMLYIDLSNPREQKTVSKFDLTNELFPNKRPEIDRHIFRDLSVINRVNNIFFISFLETSENSSEENNLNLHLAQFVIKDQQLIPLNYSVFSITHIDAVMLETESRTGGESSGSLQWLLKQNKYFSFAFLTSQRCSLWVHVFHKNSFLPVGRKHKPIPGLIQLGMHKDWVQFGGQNSEKSIVVTERLEVLRQQKMRYRSFGLTLKW